MARMTKNSILQLLKKVNYQEAINYYNIQKLTMLKEYATALGKGRKLMANLYFSEIINEINSGKYLNKAFEIVNKILPLLEANLSKQFEKNANLLQNSSALNVEKYNLLKGKALQEFNMLIKQLLDVDLLYQIMFMELLRSGISADMGMDLNDFRSWVLSYINSFLFHKIKQTSSYYNRSTVLAGYITEGLAYKSVSKLELHLNNKTAILHTGSKKITLASGLKIEPIFDIYLNFMSNNNLDKTFIESIELQSQLSSGYGGLVKLWNPPWTVKNPRKFYKIASNTTLYNLWEDKKSWVKGVLFLLNKVREAMGDNIFYVLGNNFIWTSELIEQFHKNNYYLAFNHTGTEFSATVAWETINMAKPFRKSRK